MGEWNTWGGFMVEKRKYKTRGGGMRMRKPDDKMDKGCNVLYYNINPGKWVKGESELANFYSASTQKYICKIVKSRKLILKFLGFKFTYFQMITKIQNVCSRFDTKLLYSLDKECFKGFYCQIIPDAIFIHIFYLWVGQMPDNIGILISRGFKQRWRNIILY